MSLRSQIDDDSPPSREKAACEVRKSRGQAERGPMWAATAPLGSEPSPPQGEAEDKGGGPPSRDQAEPTPWETRATAERSARRAAAAPLGSGLPVPAASEVPGRAGEGGVVGKGVGAVRKAARVSEGRGILGRRCRRTALTAGAEPDPEGPPVVGATPPACAPGRSRRRLAEPGAKAAPETPPDSEPPSKAGGQGGGGALPCRASVVPTLLEQVRCVSVRV